MAEQAQPSASQQGPTGFHPGGRSGLKEEWRAKVGCRRVTRALWATEKRGRGTGKGHPQLLLILTTTLLPQGLGAKGSGLAVFGQEGPEHS